VEKRTVKIFGFAQILRPPQSPQPTTSFPIPPKKQPCLTNASGEMKKKRKEEEEAEERNRRPL
jgi:hypothetical protein